MKYKYKILSLIMALSILIMPVSFAASQNKIVGLDDNVKSYIIANEETGEVYHEKNADESIYGWRGANMENIMKDRKSVV